jgi:hypothetical protein
MCTETFVETNAAHLASADDHYQLKNEHLIRATTDLLSSVVFGYCTYGIKRSVRRIRDAWHTWQSSIMHAPAERGKLDKVNHYCGNAAAPTMARTANLLLCSQVRKNETEDASLSISENKASHAVGEHHLS